VECISIMKEPAPGPDINRRIARRIRSLRSRAGLTLEALAGKCSVSRSMLSLIERGESSPTAVVLEKIATGLNVPLASLFDSGEAAPSPLARGAERTSWRDPQSGYVRRNISPANFPSPLRIVEVMLPAGARVAYETGVRESGIHQQIWVREGTLEFTLGGTTPRLGPDDCLAMRLDAPAAFRNRTRKPVRYIVVLTTDRSRIPEQ
jgi:transcriptional regulator with XRE-family HTH domain